MTPSQPPRFDLRAAVVYQRETVDLKIERSTERQGPIVPIIANPKSRTM
jgi:hypothetical protein